jgi:TrmH family RNA methyltransferase
MLTKNQIKHLRKLGESQYRQETGLFLAEGLKTVHELLQCPIETLAVYSVEEHLTQRWLSRFGDKVYPVGEREMVQISQLQTPPGILAECKIPRFQEHTAAIEENFSLILDGIFVLLSGLE